MTNDDVSPHGGDSGYAWFDEGSLPHSREDRVAEALALIALLFSLGIGLAIAMLPTSAQADAPAIGHAAWRANPVHAQQAPRSSAAIEANSEGGLNAGRCFEGRSPRPCVARH